MLGCLALIVLGLLIYGTYATLREPQTQRASVGPLVPDTNKPTTIPAR